MLTFLFFFLRFENLPPVIIRSFMGTAEEAIKYLDRRFYISLTGYLCKVSCIDYLKAYVIPEENIDNENGKISF